ncbi:GIY-YIG nuclease family protein [Streptomyces sp. NPDC001940]
MSERTALYRLFDEVGALLYVGITNDLEVRWSYHARQKAWWPEVHRRTVEWKTTRAEAETAEAAAIGREVPRWNVIRPDANGAMLHGRRGGRPATGKTAVRKLRADDELWSAAMAEAKEEGRSLTDVIVSDLHRYVNRRRRERGADEQPAPSDS